MYKPGFFFKAMMILALPTMANAAFKYWDPDDTASIPKTLSAMGLYTNITAKTKIMVPNAYRFDVNSPLWSDDAKKSRWVLVPVGKSIVFDEKNDYWKYPESTVFIKQFDIDTITGDSLSRILWETRIMINKKVEVPDTSKTKFRTEDLWFTTTYKWDANQQDARLVNSKKGADDSIRIYPNGRGQASKMKKWRFPSQIDCEKCHRLNYDGTVHGRSILGFFTAQLNKPSPENASINQLQNFFNKGILTGTKPADWNAPSVPRFAAIGDTKASVDLRARSYLAANCSGCHGQRGIKSGAVLHDTLNFDFHTMNPQMELRYRPVPNPFNLDSVPPFFYSNTTDAIANPKNLDGLRINPRLTVPNYPTKSVLLLRLTSRNTQDTGIKKYDANPKQMPPLGSYETDFAAAALISQWIAEMTPLDQIPPANGIRSDNIRISLSSPIIEGRLLRLPPELSGIGNVKVSLTGISGRTLDLSQIGQGIYAIPGNLSSGVYFIRVDNMNFTRYVF